MACSRCKVRETDLSHELGCPEEDCLKCAHPRKAHKPSQARDFGEVTVYCTTYPVGPLGRDVCSCRDFVPSGYKPMRVSYKREDGEQHVTLSLWCNDTSIGRICVRKEEARIVDAIEGAINAVLDAGYAKGHVPPALPVQVLPDKEDR